MLYGLSQAPAPDHTESGSDPRKVSGLERCGVVTGSEDWPDIKEEAVNRGLDVAHHRLLDPNLISLICKLGTMIIIIFLYFNL